MLSSAMENKPCLTQKLAGFDLSTLVKFSEVKPGQSLRIVYRRLVLQLVNAWLALQGARFPQVQGTSAGSVSFPSQKPTKTGNNRAGLLLLCPDPGSFCSSSRDIGPLHLSVLTMFLGKRIISSEIIISSDKLHGYVSTT